MPKDPLPPHHVETQYMLGGRTTTVDPHALGMARVGDPVRYDDKNGSEYERQYARDRGLTPDGLYVVSAVRIGAFKSHYQIEHIDGLHNAVMFTVLDSDVETPPPNQTESRVLQLAEQIEFEGYEWLVKADRDGALLQGRYNEKCIVTGEDKPQYTRKWVISPHATKSEIVQTFFKLAMTSMEHRCREHFTYRGKRIFGPHYDVDALHAIAGKVDVRPEGD